MFIQPFSQLLPSWHFENFVIAAMTLEITDACYLLKFILGSGITKIKVFNISRGTAIFTLHIKTVITEIDIPLTNSQIHSHGHLEIYKTSSHVHFTNSQVKPKDLNREAGPRVYFSPPIHPDLLSSQADPSVLIQGSAELLFPRPVESTLVPAPRPTPVGR